MLREAYREFRSAYDNLCDAATNGIIDIERILNKHCRYCRWHCREEIQAELDRIKEALGGSTESHDAVRDHPARPEDSDEDEGV